MKRDSERTRVLAIDDDPRLRTIVLRGLEEGGYSALAAEDGEQARRTLEESGPVDLLLIDVMMPGETGWDFLARLRAQGDETPAIFVTARDAVSERVKGLELGADDYLIKPFELQELLTRVAAVLRRRGMKRVTVGPLELDLELRRVSLDGRRIELSPREFELLAALARAHGRTIERGELLRELWDIDFDPGTNTVDVHVARLRKRLGPKGAALLQTVVGEGYRLSAEASDS